MAVEFALVLPLLVMLLLGLVTAGISYTHSIGLTNAVREGARFGATADVASADWVTDVIERTRTVQFDDGGPTPQTTVCVQVVGGSIGWTCDAGVAAEPPYPADVPTPDADSCIVVVAASRPFEINLAIVPVELTSGDIVRSSVARYERAC